MGKNDINALSQAISRPRERFGIESSFREWTYLISKRNIYSRFLVVDTERFFKMRWNLMNQENIETRQQIITKLTTKEKIAMIKILIDLTIDCSIEEMMIRIFKERTLSFFQIISHSNVLSSLILKTSLNIICTFLFGSNDRCAIDLFKVTAVALTALALVEFLKDDELSPIALTTSLIVLQRIVNLNQSAQVIANFTSIANTILVCIPKQLPLYVVRRSLARIRHHLDLDTSMASSENRSNKLQNHRAVFELSQNLLGMLFEQSSRHDNDHENIRDIKILSIAEEIQFHRLEYLPSNDLIRNHLPDLKDLLNRQFQLLREDTIDQFRDAIHLELERLNHFSTVQSKPNNDVRNITYHKVHLLRLTFDRRKDLQIVAEFEQPSALRKKNAA